MLSADPVSAREKTLIRVLAEFIQEAHKGSSLSRTGVRADISVESAEIASCSNDPLRKTIIVSHQDDEHGSSDIYTCNTILTDVVPPSFPLKIHYQVVPKNDQGPGASSRRREAILGAI